VTAEVNSVTIRLPAQLTQATNTVISNLLLLCPLTTPVLVSV